MMTVQGNEEKCPGQLDASRIIDPKEVGNKPEQRYTMNKKVKAHEYMLHFYNAVIDRRWLLLFGRPVSAKHGSRKPSSQQR